MIEVFTDLSRQLVPVCPAKVHTSGMWELQNSVWELVLRAAVVYGVVFVLFRLIGKKQLGQFSPFDFVLVLIVSESISQGLTGDEHSLTGAMISAATLLIISRGLEIAAYKSPRFEKLLDGEPVIIVRDGKVNEEALKKAYITQEELMSALRQYEVENVNELKFAIFETTGKITVIKKAEAR